MQLSIDEQNAYDLARMKRTMLEDLIGLREESGRSQREVADAIGRHRSAICKFEAMGGDPKLSTVFRYAHAIGAMIDVSVSPYSTWLRKVAMSPVNVGESQGWQESVEAPRASWQSSQMHVTAWSANVR